MKVTHDQQHISPVRSFLKLQDDITVNKKPASVQKMKILKCIVYSNRALYIIRNCMEQSQTCYWLLNKHQTCTCMVSSAIIASNSCRVLKNYCTIVLHVVMCNRCLQLLRATCCNNCRLFLLYLHANNCT